MKKYIKNTFVNGKQKYGVNTEVSAEDMVANFAQLHFLKQSGEDITLESKVNDEFETIMYIVTRKMESGKVVVHTYDIVEC